MTDKRTIDVYDAKAADYAKLTLAPRSPDLKRFVALLPKGARVLDIGCGPAATSAHMRDAGLVPDPVDASTAMVALANETYDIGARLGTFEDISGTYDGVWANFSLLHAAADDLPRYLQMIADTLPTGGAFHIGMKTGSGTARDALDRRYTYVTVEGLQAMLADVGFTVTNTRTGTDKALAGTVDPYVICLSQKA